MSALIPDIPNINIFAISVLLGFFSIFMIGVIWAVRVERTYVEHMSHLPLDNNNKLKNEGRIHG